MMDEDTIARLIGEAAGHKIANRLLELMLRYLAMEQMQPSDTIRQDIDDASSPILEEVRQTYAEFLSEPGNNSAFLQATSETFERVFPRMVDAAVQEHAHPRSSSQPRSLVGA